MTTVSSSMSVRILWLRILRLSIFPSDIIVIAVIGERVQGPYGSFLHSRSRRESDRRITLRSIARPIMVVAGGSALPLRCERNLGRDRDLVGTQFRARQY